MISPDDTGGFPHSMTLIQFICINASLEGPGHKACLVEAESREASRASGRLDMDERRGALRAWFVTSLMGMTVGAAVFQLTGSGVEATPRLTTALKQDSLSSGV